MTADFNINLSNVEASKLFVTLGKVISMDNNEGPSSKDLQAQKKLDADVKKIKNGVNIGARSVVPQNHSK